MIQSSVAPQFKRTPKYHQHNHRSNVRLNQIKNNRKRHLRGAHARLLLNKIEKNVLIIGVVITVGLMFMLVSTKITSDVYQHQIVTVDANISKFHNLNNDSRQRVSNLQSSGRLQRIARHNHLSFSGHDVRNVK